MMIKDKNDIEIKLFDVIDLHQTVNGENLFVVYNLEPLDIRYSYDLDRKYEYDLHDLFKPCKYTNEVEFEIVDTITLFKSKKKYTKTIIYGK